MTKQHDSVFDAVLSGVADPREASDKPRGGARFLKRGNAISDAVSGKKEEKVLHWVEPEQCRMWARHNRDYALLTEENCRDLIDGIRSQGQQEFPAIVRRLKGEGHAYEVICGARRHFAISWLQRSNYPQFKYLVEVRDLSDEEAFRLADIENRDREDISDYERAKDYASAVTLYYAGKQKDMAARLEVSEVWLSRYLELARLPSEVVSAFATIRDIRELHARTLKPLLKVPGNREKIVAAAHGLAARQSAARDGQGAFVEAPQVIATLKASVASRKPKVLSKETYKGSSGAALSCSRRGQKYLLEFDAKLSRKDLQEAIDAFLDANY